VEVKFRRSEVEVPDAQAHGFQSRTGFSTFLASRTSRTFLRVFMKMNFSLRTDLGGLKVEVPDAQPHDEGVLAGFRVFEPNRHVLPNRCLLRTEHGEACDDASDGA